MEQAQLKMPKCKKGRVPRKLKKAWKKDPYYCIFGRMWRRQYIWNQVTKDLKKYWGIKTNFAGVRDTGESIQGTQI